MCCPCSALSLLCALLQVLRSAEGARYLPPDPAWLQLLPLLICGALRLLADTALGPSAPSLANRSWPPHDKGGGRSARCRFCDRPLQGGTRGAGRGLGVVPRGAHEKGSPFCDAHCARAHKQASRPLSPERDEEDARRTERAGAAQKVPQMPTEPPGQQGHTWRELAEIAAELAAAPCTGTRRYRFWTYEQVRLLGRRASCVSDA